MKSIRILLIDSTAARKNLLEKRLGVSEPVKFVVQAVSARQAHSVYEDLGDQFDIVLFGEKIPPGTVTQLTKLIRSHTMIAPIFVFTNLAEAPLPRRFKAAGVDDMLSVAEIDTPIFSWSFISTVEQAVLRKKAKEYDVLHRRLHTIGDSLRFIIHEINNPLSVIRLAMYHLENPELSRTKRETFFKLLLQNIEKVDARIRDLYTVRRQLGGEAIATKIMSIRPPEQAGANS